MACRVVCCNGITAITVFATVTHGIIVYDAVSLGSNLEDSLMEALADNSDTKFVVIDPLQEIVGNQVSGKQEDEEDYARLSALREIAVKEGAALLVVAHTREINESNELLDGTAMGTGVSGAADTILAVFKDRNRTDQEYTLFIIGRDLPETELAVSFAPKKCR